MGCCLGITTPVSFHMAPLETEERGARTVSQGRGRRAARPNVARTSFLLVPGCTVLAVLIHSGCHRGSGSTANSRGCPRDTQQPDPQGTACCCLGMSATMSHHPAPPGTEECGSYLLCAHNLGKRARHMQKNTAMGLDVWSLMHLLQLPFPFCDLS